MEPLAPRGGVRSITVPDVGLSSPTMRAAQSPRMAYGHAGSFGHKLHAVTAFRDAKAHHELFSKDRLRDLRNPMREYKQQCACATNPAAPARFPSSRSCLSTPPKSFGGQLQTDCVFAPPQTW